MKKLLLLLFLIPNLVMGESLIKSEEEALQICRDYVQKVDFSKEMYALMLTKALGRCAYYQKEDGTYDVSAANGFAHYKHDFNGDDTQDYVIKWANSGSGGMDYDLYLSKDSSHHEISLGQARTVLYDKKEQRFLISLHGGYHCEHGDVSKPCYFERNLKDIKSSKGTQIKNHDALQLLIDSDEARFLKFSKYE